MESQVEGGYKPKVFILKVDKEKEAVRCNGMWGNGGRESLVSKVSLHSIYSSKLMHCVLLNYLAP
jgi:hypothetical protein